MPSGKVAKDLAADGKHKARIPSSCSTYLCSDLNYSIGCHFLRYALLPDHFAKLKEGLMNKPNNNYGNNDGSVCIDWEQSICTPYHQRHKGPQEGSELLAGSESSNGLSDGQLQPRLSKASVHIDREEAPADERLDARYQQDIWVCPKPPSDSSFSIDLLWWAAAAGTYGDGEEFPIFILRHRNASECPPEESCETNHWELIMDDLPTMEEGCIELQLVCMYTRYVERQMSSLNNGDFYDDQKSITIPPCQLFNDFLPDFSSVTEAGYQVVVFRLIESWEDERLTHCTDQGAWMDKHGRLLSDMH
ncbi:uncharacterized protein FOBCDRAFT_208749 [Fusarium oxysporum Fo47]|nr:uncharacterized protein FOBCDRAFT_208749 [Fusarium oxysporum Fo47]WJG37184.1 hypothetical protein FOBCDRAFT_208749 [Fusarium oxysporum Fo47]